MRSSTWDLQNIFMRDFSPSMPADICFTERRNFLLWTCPSLANSISSKEHARTLQEGREVQLLRQGRAEQFHHFTFTFLPFASVTHFAHALVQLRGILTYSIWMAVIKPQGTFIHICEKIPNSKKDARRWKIGHKSCMFHRLDGKKAASMHIPILNPRQKHAERVTRLKPVPVPMAVPAHEYIRMQFR